MMDEVLSAYLKRFEPFPDRTVSLVGLGPGDPGRLPLAEGVSHDFGRRPWAIWNLVDPNAERTLVPCEHSTGEIVAMIRPHVQAGRRVVYLVCGDPLVFERAEAVADALAGAGIAIEIVPGLTSALAGAAYAGIPLTGYGRGGAVCLTCASDHHGAKLLPPALATTAHSGTLVMYLAEECFEQVADDLRACGVGGQTPATIVEDATRSGQRVVAATLDTLAAEASRAAVGSPAVVFIGAHAAPSDRLNWFDDGESSRKAWRRSER
jgi:siroheme synthase